MELKEIISSRLSIIILPEMSYSAYLYNTLKRINSLKICYVCLVKPYMEIQDDFKQEGINTQNTFFIDTVSSKGRIIPETENCIFADSQNIISLHNAIEKASEKRRFDILILDTASALLVSETPFDIMQFTNNIISKNNDISNIYLMIKDMNIKQIENISLIKDLEMLADKKIII